MVIGRLQREQEAESQAASSAWARVEAAQRDVRLPCLLVPQPAHAVLAGELAACLLPARFGELPPEIKRAIQMHDTGWASSDAQQIQRLRGPRISSSDAPPMATRAAFFEESRMDFVDPTKLNRKSGGPQAGTAAPISFVAVSPGEAMEAWTDSIDSVEALTKTGAIIVSRHFSLLAQHDQAHHQQFIQAEKSRQQRLEGSPAKGGDTPKDGDLDRWTTALGFCDLVSLYLLSGLSREVEFPLAHPASPQAQTAPRVTMHIQGRHVHFTPAAARAGCTLSIQALKHPVPAQGPRAETLTWEVR
jgi:Protein of unknown function (DUF3891)